MKSIICSIVLSFFFLSTINAQFTGEGIYWIQAKHSGKFIEADGGNSSKGTNIKQWTLHQKPYMKWDIKKASCGGYLIKNVQTGKYIDVSEVKARKKQNVYQWSFNNEKANQRWTFRKNRDSSYFIHTELDRNYVLDVEEKNKNNGGNVQIYTKNGGDHQKFFFIKAD